MWKCKKRLQFWWHTLIVGILENLAKQNKQGIFKLKLQKSKEAR